MNINNVIADFPGTAAQEGSTSSQAKKLRAQRAGGTVALGGEGSTAATPVKRGRGRPRKNPAAAPVVKEASESPAAAPVVKRGRGRPRKNPLPPEVGSPVTKSPVVKSPVVESPVVKRGRGRPKKNASLPASSNGTVTNGAGSQEKVNRKPTSTKTAADADSNSASTTTAATETTPKKRGRGRPKKEDKPRSPTESPAPKKRRGRPPKAKGANPKKQEGSSAQPATPEVLFSSAEHEDNTVMGKLQISFSESESEGPDPMDAQQFNIDALTNIVAPAPSSNPAVAPPRDGALLEDNKFEESFDED